MTLWILTKISILKAIHNQVERRKRMLALWILTKISILKAIHNASWGRYQILGPVNPH